MSKKAQIIAIVASSLAIFYFNYSTLIVAIPTIESALSFSSEHWIVNMFYLGVVPLVLIAGKLADYYGAKKIFFLGNLLFMIGGFASGAADTKFWFLFGRLFQGAGYAFLLPTSGQLTTQTSPAHERGKFIGLYMAIATVFSPIGTVTGGLIVSYWSWRMIFYIQAVWTILNIFAGIWMIPRHKGSKELKINVPCAVLFSFGLIMLIIGIMQGNIWGWSSAAILSLLILGVLLLTLFYFFNKASKHPHIDFRLFRHPLALVALLSGFIFAGSRMVIYFWSIMLEQNFSYTPAFIGFLLLLAMLPTTLLSSYAGSLFHSLGAKGVLLIGFGLGILFNLFIAIGAPLGSLTLVILALITYGCSFPFCYGPSAALLYNHTADKFRGKASSIYMLSLQLGSIVIFAVLAALFRFIQTAAHTSNPHMTGFVGVSIANSVLLLLFCLVYLWLDKRSNQGHST